MAVIKTVNAVFEVKEKNSYSFELVPLCEEYNIDINLR